MGSLEFLARMDALMVSYQPSYLGDSPIEILGCTTEEQLEQNPELDGARQVIERKDRDVSTRRAQILRDFEKSKWVQYRIDLNWKTRIIQPVSQYGCWYFTHFYGDEPSDDFPLSYNSQQKCNGTPHEGIYWRKREGRALYSGRYIFDQHAIQKPN